MSIGKIAVLAVALILVSGGMGAALADGNPDDLPAIVDVDARKDDGADDGTLATEEEGDGDDTAGDDGTDGGAAPVQQPAQLAAGDGDQTAGDDGTDGGDNTEAAPAPATPAPAGDGDDTAGDDGTDGGAEAPAPVQQAGADDDSDDGAGAGAGAGAGSGDSTGGEDT
jgi:hypothetical protein